MDCQTLRIKYPAMRDIGSARSFRRDYVLRGQNREISSVKKVAGDTLHGVQAVGTRKESA